MRRFHRKFGCEFEFSSSFEKIASVAKQAVQEVYGKRKFWSQKRYYHSINNKQWQLKIDSSTCCELVTPVSTYEDLPKIKEVLRRIAIAKPKLTRKDGFHVHMEASGCTRYQLTSAWLEIERVFRRCFPRHRRNNDNCCYIDRGKKKQVLSQYFMISLREAEDHSSSMSLENYSERGTIEFRLGEGTVSGDTVEMFVKFYMLFMEYASQVDPVQILCSDRYRMQSLSAILHVLNVRSTKMRSFFQERHRRFNGYYA